MSYEKICDLIDKADSAYYRIDSKPIISDAEYDILKSQLKQIKPDDYRLARVGVPYDVNELRIKVKHNIPMGSLDNTDNGIDGYKDWLDNVQSMVGKIQIFASHKIDGASICATYKGGKLVRVATRGNGEVGEDITANAVNFVGLPTTIPFDGDLDVRGEAILSKELFNKICDEENIPEEERSNPRNVGNGILGRDDGRNSCYISFMAFNVVGSDAETELEKMAFLEKRGFSVVPHTVCDTYDSFVDFYNGIHGMRSQLPVEIDGIVVTINEKKLQDRFITSDIKSRLRPKYARAVKFPHMSNQTRLIDVELSVGHTGAIIPTAILQEVRVGGVNVSRALLNNWDEISRLGVYKNDVVEVVLAGDIIPKIVRVVDESTDRIAIEEPAQCPSCGSPTTRKNRDKDGANTFCTNRQCKAVAIGKIDHWIGSSKKGVGILGIGSAILEVLYQSKCVQDPADLYRLEVDQVAQLHMLGTGKAIAIGSSRAEQIIKNIKEKQILPLHTFLGALGIELLGSRRAKLMIAAAQGRLDKLSNWTDLELMRTIQLPGLGETMRDSICAGIESNLWLIEKLITNGVQIEGDVNRSEPMNENVEMTQTAANKPFAGFSFCLTGTRAYIKEIEEMGGEIKSGVSRGLTFLVQADPLSTSSKTRKADEYGVRVISIEYLKKAIDGEVKLEKDDV